jgi:hypothetical protein
MKISIRQLKITLLLYLSQICSGGTITHFRKARLFTLCLPNPLEKTHLWAVFKGDIELAERLLWAPSRL